MKTSIELRHVQGASRSLPRGCRGRPNIGPPATRAMHRSKKRIDQIGEGRLVLLADTCVPFMRGRRLKHHHTTSQPVPNSLGFRRLLTAEKAARKYERLRSPERSMAATVKNVPCRIEHMGWCLEGQHWRTRVLGSAAQVCFSGRCSCSASLKRTSGKMCQLHRLL